MILKKSSTALIIAFSINTHAAPSVFTDSALFATAISGYTTATLDFESNAAGDLVANGGTLGDIIFNYDALASIGVSMQIRDDYPATSGTYYLGTDSGGAFLGGDSFSLNFSSAHATGMFFISGDKLSGGDISLTVNNASGITEALLSSAYESTLADNGYVHFLGLVDDTNRFSSVAVASISGGNFEFNVDDITTASSPVPIPSVLWLFLAGLIPMLRKSKAES